MELNGWSLTDGSHVWTAQAKVVKWDTVRRDTLSAYGKLYCAGFDGILYCYDDKTGELLWSYGDGGPSNSTYEGLGTAYGYMPIFVDVIADGKVYLGTTEHSPGSPWYKDARYRCVNATTGEEIWTLTGWGTGMYVGQYDIVADGYFLYLNCYDMKVYSVGKGPSALTVSSPDVGVELGKSLVIHGTITDVAAGTKQDEQGARFPNGVPAVSDASMKGWMEYVYMQKPKPTNTLGVPVTIEVIDSNNNRRTIGTAVSDASGMFALTWKPDIEGNYKVIATFSGSESYWPSSAEASFVVDPAPVTSQPEYPQPVDNTMTIIYATIAIIATIVIAVVVAILMLRKRA
jgi:hypothetical protein